MRRIVYYYTYLEQPFSDVARLLSGDPALWLPPPAEATDGHWLVALRADGVLPAVLDGHASQVRVGPATTTDDKLLRSVAWQSATKERFVPVLHADVELVGMPGSGCQLSMMGSYRPPLSVVGEAGDRLVGHRIAEACVRRFLLDVADRVGAATLPT